MTDPTSLATLCHILILACCAFLAALILALEPPREWPWLLLLPIVYAAMWPVIGMSRVLERYL